jgi:hypothetical protein
LQGDEILVLVNISFSRSMTPKVDLSGTFESIRRNRTPPAPLPDYTQSIIDLGGKGEFSNSSDATKRVLALVELKLNLFGSTVS